MCNKMDLNQIPHFPIYLRARTPHGTEEPVGVGIRGWRQNGKGHHALVYSVGRGREEFATGDDQETTWRAFVAFMGLEEDNDEELGGM